MARTATTQLHNCMPVDLDRRELLKYCLLAPGSDQGAASTNYIASAHSYHLDTKIGLNSQLSELLT
jgi:hypothetical protein